MSDNIVSKYSEINNIFIEYAGRDGVITSGRDGQHGANSLHYSGEAIDLRSRDLTPAQVNNVIMALRNILGNDYDVVDEHTDNMESPHIHVEYDP